MGKFSTVVLAIAVSVGTTAMLANNNRSRKAVNAIDGQHWSDGAFRDGVYLGRLDAQRRTAPQAAVGRWARDEDRALFLAGYREGYSESVGAATR